MEIQCFLKYLYLLRKNFTFKKVYFRDNSGSYSVVLWAIRKSKSLKVGRSFQHENTTSTIIGGYDSSVDTDITKLFVVEKFQNQKVSFYSRQDVFVDISHEIISVSGISVEEKIYKLKEILSYLSPECIETFIIRMIYSIKSNEHNALLLNFLCSVFPQVNTESFTIDQQVRPQFSKICQFYDKFKFKFSDLEMVNLWLNLIKEQSDSIIESKDTHSIAKYLLEMFSDEHKEILFPVFPLMKEKFIIKNNIENPFDFQNGNKHKRFLFEFNKEQMMSNLSNDETKLEPVWAYSTFNQIANNFLIYMTDAYKTEKPQFISKDNDPIYSAIVYANGADHITMLKELLLDLFYETFIFRELSSETKDNLMEKIYFDELVLSVIIKKNIRQQASTLPDDENESDNYKL